jgi:hypothetical protein
MMILLMSATVALIFLSNLWAETPIPTPAGVFVLNQGEVKQGVLYQRGLAGFEKVFTSTTGYSAGDFPPIQIVLHPSDPLNLVSSTLRVDEIEGGLLRIQVDIFGGSLDDAETRRLLAESMVLRQYYKGVAPLGGSRIPVFPEWFLHGLGLICSPDIGKNVIPSGFLTGQNAPTIEDFLIQRPPQDDSRILLDLYDAKAAALVQAGLKSKEGAASLQDWIGHYEANAAIAMPSNWPSGWKMRPIEKRWLLLMAGSQAGDKEADSLLTVPMTLARYDSLIRALPTPDHSLALLKNQKGGEFIGKNLASSLLALRLQSNPMVAELLDKTIRLLDDLKHLSLKKLQDREKELSLLRSDILKKSIGIREYLDWYEAAKVPVSSGLFDTLLATPESPMKRGPIGRYLDKVEKLGW